MPEPSSRDIWRLGKVSRNWHTICLVKEGTITEFKNAVKHFHVKVTLR